MQLGWLGIALVMIPTILVLPAAVPMPATSTVAPHAGSLGVPPQWGPNSTRIRHIITVVMENHDYDNFFGVYCQQLGAYCSDTGNGVPPGTCVPYNPANLSYGCIVPYNLTPAQFVVKDMQHDWISGPQAWDDGKMDGFYAAEHDSVIPFGHYNGSTIPIYWDMAEEYTLGDNFYATNLSYSLPNHWDLVAGQAPAISSDSYIKTSSDRLTYRTESNATPTVEDLLNGTNVSWKYYDFGLIPMNLAYAGSPLGSAYDYWNPLAARGESYTSTYSGHLVPRTDFLTDIANGSLPDLSWVIPSAPSSDHPGYNLTQGNSWVAQLVDSVENSSYWNSTVIFVVWDDYGGWYDHVTPPLLPNTPISFRSPILVISPYAKENYISHAQLDFFSLLRYEEWQFSLPCMGALDCSATLPFDFFDFNQTARPPILFATNWTQAHYPMPLQGFQPVVPLSCVSCTAVKPTSWETLTPYIPDPDLGD